MHPVTFACRMHLRAIAVGIVAVVGLSAPAAAEEITTVLVARGNIVRANFVDVDEPQFDRIAEAAKKILTPSH